MSWEKKSGSGGSTVTSSLTNGHITVNGQDLKVFDNSLVSYSLSQISDFDVTNKTNGNVMTYDSTSGKVKLQASSGSNVVSDTVQQYSHVGHLNLLDASKIEQNFYYSASTGARTALNGYGSTDFIEVEPGVTYFKSWASEVSYWDVNKTFVTGTSNTNNIVVPLNQNIKYVKTSLQLSLGKWLIVRQDINRPQPGLFQSVPSNGAYALSGDKFVFQPFEPNATIPLFIETPSQYSNQPIHPKALSFDTAWNGYRYWLAYTPYPDASDPLEDPCIACSNDMIYWTTPTGFTNPLATQPTEVDPSGNTYNYNSDTTMIYNSTSNTLEVWWRAVVGTYESLRRRTSTDGINWTTMEIMWETLNWANKGTDLLKLVSPALIWENGTYKCWLMQEHYVRYYTSTDGKNWTDNGNVVISGTANNIYTWHLDVMYNKNKQQYELLNYVENGGTNTNGWLEHFTSTDGINWTQTPFVVTPSKIPNQWDSSSLYRSTLLYADNKYYMIYTGIQKTGSKTKWRLGLAMSVNGNIMTMKGVDVNYKHLMAQPTRRNAMGNVNDVIFDQTLNKPIYCKSVDANGVRTWVDATGTVV